MKYVWLMLISMSLACMYAAEQSALEAALLEAMQDNIRPPEKQVVDDTLVDVDLGHLHDAMEHEMAPAPPAQRFRIIHDIVTPNYTPLIIAQYVAHHDNQLHPCAILHPPLNRILYTAIAAAHTAHWPLSLYVYAQGHEGQALTIHRPPDFATGFTLHFDTTGKIDLSRSFYSRCVSHSNRKEEKLFFIQQKHSEENPFMQLLCSDMPCEIVDDAEYECINETNIPSSSNEQADPLNECAETIETLDETISDYFTSDIPPDVRARYTTI